MIAESSTEHSLQPGTAGPSHVLTGLILATSLGRARAHHFNFAEELKSIEIMTPESSKAETGSKHSGPRAHAGATPRHPRSPLRCHLAPRWLLSLSLTAFLWILLGRTGKSGRRWGRARFSSGHGPLLLGSSHGSHGPRGQS